MAVPRQQIADESFQYLSVADLEKLSAEELEGLWDSVPTEAREFLERRYRQAVKEKGIGADEKEVQLIQAYLERYHYEGLVPAAKQWLKLSPKLRRDYAQGGAEKMAEKVARQAVSPIVWLAALGLLFFLGIIVFNFMRATPQESESVVLSPSSTLTASPTSTATVTAVPSATITPSPTPLALLAGDQFIRAGDSRRAALYPVQFQIYPDDRSVPRVFIVQGRTIQTSEWRFDTNPDVVSWLIGSQIRPILGIPYSDANADFLQNLPEGALFVLRMNTGLELRFRLRERHWLGREETNWFRQLEPGLVLSLLGELDTNTGLPTAQRLLLLANYEFNAETDSGLSLALPHDASEILFWDGMSFLVTTQDLRTVPHRSSSDLVYAHVRFALQNQSELAHDLQAYQFYLLLGDERYRLDAQALNSLSLNRLPATLGIGATLDLDLAFLVPHFEGTARLMMENSQGQTQQFLLDFPTMLRPASLNFLDLRVRQISVDRALGRLYIDARLFNPQMTNLVLDASDFSLVFGFNPAPAGPRVHPLEFADFELAAQTAVDLRFAFAWNGQDPYARFTVGSVIYDVQILR